MEFVVDANILIAALLKDNYTRKLLILSNDTFYVPEYIFNEIMNHLTELEEKSHVPKEVLKEVLFEIIHAANIHIIPIAELQSYYAEAKRISPDKDDAYYFALAIKNSCSIWSNDKKLKTQNNIKIYHTQEMTKR